MKLRSSAFVEHRAVGEQFSVQRRALHTSFVLPGACTSCNGSSSTSCCSSSKTRRPESVLSNLTFVEAASSFAAPVRQVAVPASILTEEKG